MRSMSAVWLIIGFIAGFVLRHYFYRLQIEQAEMFKRMAESVAKQSPSILQMEIDRLTRMRDEARSEQFRR